MWAPAKKKKLFVRPFSPPVCVLSLAAVFALPEQQFSLTPLLPISSMATSCSSTRQGPKEGGGAMVGKRMEKLQGGRTDRGVASAAATMRT